MDFCQIVRDIEKDPTARVPLKTVRDLLLLRAHVASCDPCSKIVDKVLRRPDYPDDGIVIGLN